MESITQLLGGLLHTPEGSFTFTQIFFALGVAYLGGVLSSLTPCIYPMIPITIGVVGGMAENRKMDRLIFRSLVYVSGMCIVYAFLGVLAALTGQVFGTLTQKYGWYLLLGFIMSASALVMLEIIPFDPMAWIDRLLRKFSGKGKTHPTHSPTQHKEMTTLGAFSLGATSGFIAAPCTTPVLTAILAFIANTQSVGLGFFLMLAFAIGLGTLLLIIALFAGSLQILPRSGQWMMRVKILSGLVLLAFGHYMIFIAGTMRGSS